MNHVRVYLVRALLVEGKEGRQATSAGESVAPTDEQKCHHIGELSVAYDEGENDTTDIIQCVFVSSRVGDLPRVSLPIWGCLS
jgi:hypothetical protein